MNKPEVGKTYSVVNNRKGRFKMTVTDVNDTFASGVIVAGKAGAMLPENEREQGDEVTVRISFCSFEIAA